ncbi:MAG: MoxR family ATPase [Deltaproteobacteria bacterium]|nr:MoxR family ATPase [Deltaproteobacteria bacterium]
MDAKEISGQPAGHTGQPAVPDGQPAGLAGKIRALKENLGKVILGKADIIDLAIATLLARGHLLVEDVPGVGKTTLAHGLARSIAATFKRIQFTSDLMPSDVIGVTIYNEAAGGFEFRHGPVFANVVLADEINRATPKTQSALLEAMSEGQVSVENVTYRLPRPFILLATQNPVEYAGTFPLPESQLDRFAMSIKIGYPDEETEKAIIGKRPFELTPERLSPVVSALDVTAMQEAVEEVKVEEDLLNYIVKIATGTRTNKAIKLGVSPRGTMALHRAAQAMALVYGRDYCIPDDIKKVAVPVLAHRIIPAGYSTGETFEEPHTLIEEVIEGINVPI